MKKTKILEDLENSCLLFQTMKIVKYEKRLKKNPTK